ncbi:MAG: hypothetical protein IJX14_09480, partial [Clostridia bacterium]|nr:hypothetical protein [Clostridia bacterium]
MKKITVLLLLAAMLLASCGQAGEAETTAEAAGVETAAVETEPETEDPYRDTVEAEDFGGRTFHFLLYGTGAEISWSVFDVIAEEATGEGINDAIYNRNLTVNEKYNVEITGIMDASALNILSNAVKAGDSTFDAAFLDMYNSGSAAQSGILMDYG